VYFTEEGGPISLVGPAATITDDDTVARHKRVDRLCISIVNPMIGDQLVPTDLTHLTSNTPEMICINLTHCGNNFSSNCFNLALNSVKFNNILDEPDVTDRHISYTVYDTPGNLHSTDSVTVIFDSINDKQHDVYLNHPSANYSTTFIEEGPAVLLSGNLIISHNDTGPLIFNQAIVTILSASPYDALLFNGSVIPANVSVTLTHNDTQLIIDGEATQDDYRSLLATVAFINTDDEPTPPHASVRRLVQFNISDDVFDAMIAMTTVTIEPVNDCPMIPSFRVMFNETSRDPINLFSTSIMIDDSDHTILENISIMIYPSVDSMDNVTIANVSGLNITRSAYNGSIISACDPAVNEFTVQEIILEGPANKSTFEEALYSIMYSNGCPGISLTPRSLLVSLNDGACSHDVWIYIDIIPLDDGPVCYFGSWPGSRQRTANFSESSSCPPEEAVPVFIAADFNLTDLDGPDDYTDPVYVTISELADGDHEMINFATNGTNVTFNKTESPTEANGFTSTYKLSNGRSYAEYNKVLATMTYLNNKSEPSDQLIRPLTINITRPGFALCTINITVINIPDPPMIHIPPDYTPSYTEDQGPVPVTNTSITITDEDNYLLYEAKIYIANTPVEYGANDFLYITADSNFVVSGNGTNSITATATSYVIGHPEFVNLLKTVTFASDDQSTDITRTLTMTVEEFPLGDTGPSKPANISITFNQLNDRPILTSPLIDRATLDNYLPPSINNPGFSPSFLVNSSVVSDVDSDYPSNPDFIGLAIFSLTSTSGGQWQHFYDNSWNDISVMSLCNPVFVSPSERIRFLPPSNYTGVDSAYVNYRVWDGTTKDICDINGFLRSDQETSLSVNVANFHYIIPYLNRPPVIFAGSHNLTSTREDIPSDGEMAGNIASAIATDEDNTIYSLAVIYADGANGTWQYSHHSNQWIDFPLNLSSSYALHLDPTASIRFVPSLNFVGCPTIEVHAWDGNNLVGGSHLDYLPSPLSYSGRYSLNTSTLSLCVIHVNDPPVISIANDTITFTENGLKKKLFSQLVIADTDNATLQSAVVVLKCQLCTDSNASYPGDYGSGHLLTPESTDHIISLYTGNMSVFNVTIVSQNSSMTMLRITAINGGAPLLTFQNYLSSLSFYNTMDEPLLADRIASLWVSDGLAYSNVLMVTIVMQQDNDNPPVITLPYNTFDYSEQSGFHDIFTQPPAVIRDVDESLLLDYLQVTIVDGNPHTESLASSYNGSAIVVDSNGLRVNFTGPASLGDFNEAINSLAYSNTIDEPGRITRTIRFAINDGKYTAMTSLSIEMMPVNDNLPLVILNVTQVTLIEGNPVSPPIHIASNVIVTDDDVPVTPVNSAIITIHNPVDGSSEYFSLGRHIPGINATSISGGVLYITSSNDDGIAPVTLQDALRAVLYHNDAEEPSPDTRNISIIVTDIFDESSVQQTPPVYVYVNIILTDDSPRVNIRQSVVKYIEDQQPILIAGNATITDVDDVTLDGLYIELSTDDDITHDVISINQSLLALTSIAISSNNSFISLTGPASLGQYQAILRSLRYGNNDASGDTLTHHRYVLVTPIGTGTGQGVADTVIINVNSINDKPLLDLNGPDVQGFDYSVIYTEESNSYISLLATDFSLTDTDDSHLVAINITLTPYLDIGQEALQVIPNENVTVIEETPYSVRLIANPSAPISSFRDVLSTVSYINTADEPQIGNRMVEFIVSDGKNSSQPVYTHITIDYVNDPPMLYLNGSYKNYSTSWTENDPPVLIANNPVVLDDDNLYFTQVRITDVSQISGDVINTTSGLNIEYSPNYYTISFPSPVNAASVQNVISSLVYTSTSMEPPNGLRRFCIIVFDEGHSQSSPSCTDITFEPVNDNPPLFPSESYSTSVIEEKSNAVVSVNFMISDADDVNSVPYYVWSIIDGDDCHVTSSGISSQSLFSGSGSAMGPIINPLPCRFSISNNGMISTTMSPPDRETKDSYNLTISVTDGPHTSYTTVYVSITDTNDNPTCFSPTEYNISIPFGYIANTVLTQLMITDPDTTNSQFGFFQIVPGSMSGTLASFFQVDGASGNVWLIRDENEPILCTDSSLHSFQVTFDDGTFSSENFGCQATVNAFFPVNNPPTFDPSLYTFMVNEGTPVNTPLLAVTATDGDEGSNGQLIYSLQPERTPFSINSSTGVISVSANIDYETANEYNFTVIVRDGGTCSLSASAPLTIHIIDVNECSPIFDEFDYEGYICENSPLGADVGIQLLASDCDTGPQGVIVYSMTYNGGCSDCFEIDPAAGRIHVAKDIDYENDERSSNFFVYVRNVNDSMVNPINFATVTVNILNDNEYQPSFNNSPVSVSIPENISVNTPLPVQLIAIDLDGCNVDQCNGTSILSTASCGHINLLSYEITAGNTDDLFSIDSTSGIISVVAPIDYESLNRSSYNLTISVSDVQYTATGYINVMIVNISESHPMFISDVYTASIIESASIGTEVLTVRAVDADNSNFKYSLDDDSHFVINAYTGVISLAQSLDREQIDSFTLIVEATETALPSMFGSATVNITITDVNDNPPMFSNASITLYVDEDDNLQDMMNAFGSGNQRLIGTISAIDPDINPSTSYSIISNNSNFIIDSLTGTVYSNSVLDYELTKSYSFIIVATDNDDHSLSSSITVTININDINDNIPVFSRDIYSATISEALPVNHTVITVSATDADSGMNRKLTYSIDDSSLPFSIHPSTGVITLKDAVDRETADAYTFNVTCTDHGVPPLSSTSVVNVTITDVNDNMPNIRLLSLNSPIPENNEPGITVATFEVTDPDIGGNALSQLYVVSDITSFSNVLKSDLQYILTNVSFGEITNSLNQLCLLLNETSSPHYNETILISTNNVKVQLQDLTSNLYEITLLLNDSSTYNETLHVLNQLNLWIDNLGQFTNDLSELLSLLVSSPHYHNETLVLILADDVGYQLNELGYLRESTSNLFEIALGKQIALDNSYEGFFNVTQDGIVTVEISLDYEIFPLPFALTLLARNLEVPHWVSSYPFQISVTNINDNPSIVNVDVNTIQFNERENYVNLAAANFAITDADTINFTQIHSAAGEFTVFNPMEPSYPFVPTSSSNPSQCSTENKLGKMSACRVTPFSILPPLSPGNELFNFSSQLSDDKTTLYLNGINQFAYINTPSFSYGNFSFLSWIRYSPTNTSTIFSYVTETRIVFSAVCMYNDLEFSYYSNDVQQTINVMGACGKLTEMWHHLAIVVNTLDNVNYKMTTYIDGYMYHTQNVPRLQDSNEKRLFIGARPISGRNEPVKDYFTGDLHRLSFSDSYITDVNINGVIGCGVYLLPTIHSSSINYSYNYTSRSFSAEGISEPSDYDALLNSMRFVNAFEEPQTATYTLALSVNDDSVLNINVSSRPTRNIAFNVNPRNDGPVDLRLNGPLGINYSALFTEEAGPISIVNESSLTLTDTDGLPIDYEINATIINPLQNEERLFVSNLPDDLSQSYANFTLIVSGMGVISDYETVLKTLQYDNTADELIGDGRTIRVYVKDPLSSNLLFETQTHDTAYSHIDFHRVNDPPVISIQCSITEYAEGDGRVPLIPSSSITDDDNITLVSARIEFIPYDGASEKLFVNTTGTHITSHYYSANDTNVLELVGVDTLMSYASVIGSLTYEHNRTDAITGTTRMFHISVNDGIDMSQSVMCGLFLKNVNDFPVIDLNGNGSGNDFSVTFKEDVNSVVPAVSSNLTIIDVDSTHLSDINITFIDRPDGQDEYLTVSTLDTNLTFIADGNSYIISSSSLPVLTQTYQSVLRTLKYHNTLEEPTPSTRMLLVTASDGSDTSLPVYSRVTVEATNDQPMVDLDVYSDGTGFVNVFIEEGSPSNLSSTPRIHDNDRDATITTIRIKVTNALDNLNDQIISLDDNITLPMPASMNNVITYTITPTDTSLEYINYFISQLAYSNILLEPTPGERLVHISVSDGYISSNVAVANITLETINDHVPKFPQDHYMRFVLENQPAGTAVGMKIEAVDCDSGDDGIIDYYIIQATPPIGLDSFTINSTGNIITTTSLDREEIDIYRLVLMAADRGNPSYNSTVNVTIQITDINDNDPSFSQDVYSLSVPETAPLGTLVDVAMATDPDLPLNNVGYESNTVTFFVGANGNITVAAPLDADVPNPIINFTVIARDSGGREASAIYSITILDENDNDPIFAQSTYQAIVSENINSAYVTAVSATDRDSGSNALLTYDILDGSTQFVIDNVTGIISTAATLDRESTDEYNLTVRAVDNGSLRRTGTAIVRVTVGDVNDNSPMFNQTYDDVSVAENAMNGTHILRVFASDPDDGPNGTVRYQLADNHEVFVIDSSTGDITLDGVLDRETTPSYHITVYAVDQGWPLQLSSSVNVTVFITDVNDNAPVFIGLPYMASVPENSIDYPLITIRATDADIGTNGQVHYALNDHNHLFSIDANTGDIHTLPPGLDFELECSYVLSVTAYDSGQPSRNTTGAVYVSVIPVNDRAPVFNVTSRGVEVMEDAPIGSVVMQLTAYDDDSTNCNGPMSGSGMDNGNLLPNTDDNVAYSLLNHTDVFHIDTSSGLLTTIASLDREAVSSYTIGISATDDSSLSSTVVIDVTVGDVNDNTPEFIQPLYTASISENVPIGMSVLSVRANDPDEGTLLYELSAGPSFLSIDPQTGEISTVESIDFENLQSTYNFFAIVNDTVSASITNIIVNITDVNDNPPSIDTQSSTITFTQGLTSTRPIPMISISDPDSFQTLSSAVIVLITPESTPNMATGCSCSNSSLPSTCTPGCMEFIQLSSSYSFPGNATISSDGYTLTLSGDYPINVYEQALEHVEYINIRSTPLPDDRLVSLVVNDGLFKSNVFSNTIQMVLLNQFMPVIDLNGPAVDGNNFMITFTEEGSPVSIANITAFISDNDTALNESILTGLDVELVNPQDENELIRLNSTYLVPSAIDMTDMSSQHLLSFRGEASVDDYSALLRQLEYVNLAAEPSPVPRHINFRAYEHHLSSRVATTTITIATLNDNPPTILADPPFTNFAFVYRETAGSVPIVSSNAIIEDKDSTESPISRLSLSILVPGQFDKLSITYINESYGITLDNVSNTELILSGLSTPQNYLDVLRNVVYTFTSDEFIENSLLQKFIYIRLSDDSFSSYSVTHLSLRPQNDQQPQFTSSVHTLNISENATIGQPLVQLTATDNDTFNTTNMHFNITSGNSDNLFNISSTGLISINKRLDYEMAIRHQLTVEVRDLLVETGNDPPGLAHVTISVIDSNDNVPQFNQSHYSMNISEGAPEGSFVLRLFASDADGTPSYTQLVFDITGSQSHDFIIDSNGNILTNAIIDRERTSSYNFTATVRNPQSLLHDTAVIYITVLDRDDNPPVITLNPSSAMLTQLHTLLPLADKLAISDVDPQPSLISALVYIDGPGILTISSDIIPHDDISVAGNNTAMLNVSGLDTLSRYESILRSVHYIDTSEKPSIDSRRVSYKVISPSGSVSNVTVFNISVDYLSPMFNMTLYHGEVDENSPPGTPVGVIVRATDSDAPSASFIYSISPSDQFTIDSSGNVTTLVSLDAESLPSHILLTVTAAGDGDGGISQTSTAIVNVTLHNVNDNPPSFDQESYSTNVSENVQFYYQVRATDPDNDLLVYSLVASCNVSKFTINPMTGLITTIEPLDRETTPTCTLLVLVSDSIHNDTAVVTIAVGDLNDHAPTFDQPIYNASIAEYALPGITVVTVRATDLDAGNNSQLTYRIQGGNTHNAFDILSDGDIVVNAVLDYEEISQYNLTVIAIDEGNPPMNGTTQVIVTIDDHNDNTPRIFLTNNDVTYIEQSGQVLIASNVTIIDPDTTMMSNATVVFTIMICQNASSEFEQACLANPGYLCLYQCGEAILLDTATLESFNITQQDHSMQISLVITGQGTTDEYRSIFSSITYVNYVDEPLNEFRTVELSVNDGVSDSNTALINITMSYVNDHCPHIYMRDNATSIITYTEGTGALNIGDTLELSIEDDDMTSPHKDLTGLTVHLLDIKDGSNENVMADIAGFPQLSMEYFNSSAFIIRGQASINVYTSLLHNLTYQNVKDEPTPGVRTLMLTPMQDPLNCSTTLHININVTIINDNQPIITFGGNSTVTYVESNKQLSVGLLMSPSISDADDNQVFFIQSGLVRLEGHQDGSNEMLGLSGSLPDGINATVGNHEIMFEGSASLLDYQQALSLVTYINQSPEPSLGIRMILFQVYDGLHYSNDLRGNLSIQLVNNNRPVVDLNGPTNNGFNYSTSLIYDYQTSARTKIASSDTTITDSDANSSIMTITVDLVSHQDGDSIDIQYCDFGSAPSGLCYIRITGLAVPNCSCNQPIPSFDLNITYSPTSLSISQTGSLSNTYMTNVLRDHLYFQHSTNRPNSSYTSVISVTANDGLLTSDPAYTTVLVNFNNLEPIIELTQSFELMDGQTMALFASNITIIDDSTQLLRATVHLTNPVHLNDESITISLPDTSGITMDSSSTAHSLILNGPATIDSFVAVLQSLTYQYTRMYSYLEGQPDTRERLVTISVTDIEGRANSADVSITFDRNCTKWSLGNTINLPDDLSSANLKNCIHLSSLSLKINGPIPNDTIPSIQNFDSLIIRNQDSPTLAGLENLLSFNELVIEDMPHLVTLSNIGANAPPGHRTTIQSIGIHDVPLLQDISGLRIVENITGVISIQNCPQLTNLDGLNNLVTAGTIILAQLPITNISGLNNLFKVSELWLYRNNLLGEVSGFQGLRVVNVINIVNNPQLVSIDGLSGLQNVGVARVYFNAKLCYIGTGTPNEAYWMNLTAVTMGDFVSNADCPSRSCSDTPCLNNGQCTDSNDGYTCSCSDLYFGPSCQYLNACTAATPCHNNATCTPNINIITIAQYTCTCTSGFTGSACEVSLF
jgi:hypothetical protein